MSSKTRTCVIVLFLLKFLALLYLLTLIEPPETTNISENDRLLLTKTCHFNDIKQNRIGKIIDCQQLFARNREDICQAKFERPEPDISAVSFNRSTNIVGLRKLRKPVMSIAYSILVYQEVKQLLLLFDAVYSPFNYYCIYPDRKSIGFTEEIERCNVVIASRKGDMLQAAAEKLNRRFPPEQVDRVLPVTCNIRKEQEVDNLMKATLSKYGHIDFLVNNGGGQFPSPLADVSLKGWNAVIETNLTGTFLVSKAVYHHYMRDHGGVVVNIITDMCKGWPMMAHSGAARAGVENLTKSLSIEWAHHGIRVNAVAPGSSIYSETAAGSYADPELFQKRTPHIPAKRLGNPEEVSAAVCYLLSPAASYVTGETLKIDGGASNYAQLFWTVPDHNKSEKYSWEEDCKNIQNKSKL